MRKPKGNESIRAYVLIAGRNYPPFRRTTAIKRGHEITNGKPLPDLTPAIYRWLVVSEDR